MKCQPDLGQQKPAAILLDHAALGVGAVVEVGGELVAEDLAKPNVPITRFLVALTNPAPDRRQSGRLEALRQAKHLQLAFRC